MPLQCYAVSHFCICVFVYNQCGGQSNAVLYVTLATCLDRVVAAARHVRSLTELSRQVSSLATGGLARDPIRAACPTSMDLPNRVSIEPLRWNAMQGGVNWDLNLGILKEESDTSKKQTICIIRPLGSSLVVGPLGFDSKSVAADSFRQG